MKKLILLFSCFYACIISAQDLELELFASGLNTPAGIKSTVGDDRLFVIEIDGKIRIVNTDGSLETLPFLDISHNVDTLSEAGLLGLAFHPNYAVNGYFYVNYINNINNNRNTVISRFTRNATNPSIADPNSELIILTFSRPSALHNGGDMAFGPDGYLYIASGDGAEGINPAQELNNLRGKILRIDIDNTSNGNNYAIPAGNPFVDIDGALDEIWAYGLRNPWRFSFDRLNNDLWIADVGSTVKEEINRVPFTDSGGQNYGWRCYEASVPHPFFPNLDCPPMETITFPVAEYDRAPPFCAITGGYRYRGNSFPNFQGVYFFADVCGGMIGYLTPNGSTWDMTFKQFSGNTWVTFGESNLGELYVADFIGGDIYRLIDASLSVNEETLDNISIYPNPAISELNIKTNRSLLTLDTIKIYNTLGKLVKEVKPLPIETNTISTDDLSRGLYIIEVIATNGQKLTQKLVIN